MVLRIVGKSKMTLILCISLQMMEAMNDSVKAIEEKMSAAFTKIDDRLELLEAQTAGSLVSKF